MIRQIEARAYLDEVLACDNWIGDGPFSRRCEALIRQQLRIPHAYLTPSCTSALEIACLLADIGPGDEVIMPSFGFSSAANAVVLRGATPVFVDIRADTLNIDETLIEAAITPRTRAIVVVHYAGVCCEMGDMMAMTSRDLHLWLIEDAAQAYLSAFEGAPAGTLCDAAAFSFHHTKNIRCGEGGALVVTNYKDAARAEVIREKGTNRSAFLRGGIDKYTWQDVGVSGVVSEFQAAVLLAQLEQAQEMTDRRVALWRRYQDALVPLEQAGKITRQHVPPHCRTNGHIAWCLLPSAADRDRVLARLRADAVAASFHFVPLHSAPAGRRFGRVAWSMRHTDDCSARLLRLPLTHATTEADVDRAVERLGAAL